MFRTLCKSIFFLALCILALNGCTSSKSPLEGKRESIGYSNESTAIDGSMSGLQLGIAPVARHYDTSPNRMAVGFYYTGKPNFSMKYAGHMDSMRIQKNPFEHAVLYGTLSQSSEHSVRQKLYFVDQDYQLRMAHVDNGHVSSSTIVKDLGALFTKNSARDLGYVLGMVEHNNVLYVNTSFGGVCAIDLHNHKILWHHVLSRYLRSGPTIVRNDHKTYVVIQSIENEFLAMNIKDGKVEWHQTKPSDGIHYQIHTPSMTITSDDAYGGQSVAILPFKGGIMEAWHIGGQRPLWRQNFISSRRLTLDAGGRKFIIGPTLDKSRIYAGFANGLMACLDALSGRILWQRLQPTTQSPLVAGDYVCTVDNDWFLLMNRHNGHLLIQESLHKNLDEARFERRWMRPVIINNHAYILSNDGNVCVYDMASHKMIKRFTLDHDVSAAPFVLGDTMFVIDQNGYMHLYQ